MSAGNPHPEPPELPTLDGRKPTAGPGVWGMAFNVLCIIILLMLIGHALFSLIAWASGAGGCA